jgi:hypothetical protein
MDSEVFTVTVIAWPTARLLSAPEMTTELIVGEVKSLALTAHPLEAELADRLLEFTFVVLPEAKPLLFRLKLTDVLVPLAVAVVTLLALDPL